ncbi:hypothetical protein ACJIZ3_012592 [Penstemon smallii]|uniref:RING-type E3 ubiquitin transferase n=1 Tax=Penstemon smallii TaxID=265156 RepID=A0ABD3UNS0_9LAMI
MATDLNPLHWHPKIICLLGLIFIIFLSFTYYKILHRNCATFRVINLTRNSDQRRRINEHLEEFSSHFQSRALESYIMYSLPITQIKKNKDEELQLGSRECVVCLGEFEEDDWVKVLPNCSHVFHVSCIDIWFQTHSSCPLCRSYVYNINTLRDQCSISMHSFMGSLDREDFHRERSEHYQVMRSQILHDTQESSLELVQQPPIHAWSELQCHVVSGHQFRTHVHQQPEVYGQAQFHALHVHGDTQGLLYRLAQLIALLNLIGYHSRIV